MDRSTSKNVEGVQEDSSIVKRQRNLITNDPCLEYFDPLTKLLCKTCDSTDPDSTYHLFIMSSTIVHCASYAKDETVCTVGYVTLYLDVKAEVMTLLNYFNNSKADYGDITYHESTTYHKSLCIN